MPRDYSDPLYMRFLKETYEKENEQRVFWFLKNETNLKTINTSEKHKGYTKEAILKESIEKSMQFGSAFYKCLCQKEKAFTSLEKSRECFRQ